MDVALAPAASALVAVRRHRAELRESIGALEQALAAPAPGRGAAWGSRVHTALAELAGDFATHVELTESDGLYRDVLSTAPRLSYAVERLVREHVEITTAIDELIGQVEPAVEDPDVDEVRDGGVILLGRLVRHRQRGADLVYEAYQSDIGGET